MDMIKRKVFSSCQTCHYQNYFDFGSNLQMVS